jgi:RNA-directed DNA polymerase
MDPILARDNLRLAYWRASRGKRTTGEVVAFASDLDGNLGSLAGEVSAGVYRPGPAHQFTIHDPKQRTITAPCFRDRVLHHAIMNVCEPIFDRRLIDETYACRSGRGRDAALARAVQFARGHGFFLKMDVRKYFDSIDHAILMRLLERTFKDARLLDLFGRVIAAHEVAPGRGVPIGSLTSQHFANFYLSCLDRFVKEGLRFQGYVRYMDDFVVWGDDRRMLGSARDAIREFLDRELGLDAKPEPYINRCVGGMDFLGCRVYPSHLVLNRRSRVRFRAKVRWLGREHGRGWVDDRGYQERATALVAFAKAGGVASWRWRSKALGYAAEVGQGVGPGDPGR